MRLRYFALILVCYFQLTTVFSAEKLIFAIDLIRHGDRTPLKELPHSTHTWKEGLGELTPEGQQQEYELGTKLRKEYVDEYHLLPSHYESQTIYVRSTDINRTKASALALLSGLYPEATREKNIKIPIHFVDKEKDTLLLATRNSNIFSQAKYYLKERQEWREKTAPLKEKLSKWSKLTGLPLHNFQQLDYLADNLEIRQIHHIPLPIGMSTEDANTIISLNKIGITNTFKSDDTYPMGKVFLKTVADSLNKAAQQPTSLKYILYSAHDSSILSVMNALGAPLTDFPRYASRLNFSVFQEADKYIVKISLNDKLVMIPECGPTACTLDQLNHLARK